MKKIIEVSIGKINFTMEDDAYFRLKEYLKRFEDTIPDKNEAREVMEDVEARVAELFQKEMRFSNQVVDMALVQIVIDHLGEVEGASHSQKQNTYSAYNSDDTDYTKGDKRFFRDIDNKMLAGVCSGLSEYTGIDVTIIRVIFVVLVFAYGTAILAYIVLWIVAPRALSVAQKLQMRGFAPTAENIRKYTSQSK
ncbi:phage shock protein PspC (stress-responsive transcriptional regulator) [Dysgonomonas hofstadii]|uniref:Phage shock protein PspC (Stress-responsive transcriptional regulator) n=1 Tax=Dysgonomonas hofstadii TaxID=637886 RepID=A0A840CUF5_9BACT|nr:PspC domain-containing protein [Dysgonomonas hofstadii]MBB4036122.1 phage shock protein PspC (stress-responsive transcriptional regulator) [Dysgonomonas hofstadii]